MEEICIVAIAKGEGNYIAEFVDYHLALGFDHIIIYDNESTPVYQDLLTRTKSHVMSRTHIVHFPRTEEMTIGVQYHALSHFVAHFMERYTHVLHIDIDEFVVLKRHTDIKAFIRDWISENPDCAGVGFNTKIFGDGFLPSPFPDDGGSGDFSQVGRFVRCQTGLDPLIKTLFRTEKFQGFRTVHDIRSKYKNHVISADASKSKLNGPMHVTSDDSVAHLNHYKCKTWNEFRRAWWRGRADYAPDAKANQKRLWYDGNDVFHNYNRNDSIDTHARDFYLAYLSMK